ncbi:MAG: translation elongation factor Ts [Clostridia bacterium]|nr:translation elongation factor Ts [Clostridia bacterium]
MAVTAAMVKEIRERTGAGMMDCKKALTETDGDMDKAIEILREKGLAKAAKKSGRIAAEGLINLKTSDNGDKAIVVEVNSETDFVAKNEEFKAFVNDVAELLLNSDIATVEELLSADLNGITVQEMLNNKISKIGENMNIRRFERFNTPSTVNVGYIHGGGRIGVIVELATEAAYNEVEALGKDIAMQIAAMNPKYISEADVDQAYIENEKKILTQQALNEGKPEAIVEKMVVGRLKKELKQVCLLDQAFVKDGDINVGQYVKNCGKDLGKDIKVNRMVRFEIGEGIEKKEENFADEVAKQINN